MALESELKQLTLVAYHATHLGSVKQLGTFWTAVDSVLSLLIATVQKVLVTGNGIILVVFLPLHTKIIVVSRAAESTDFKRLQLLLRLRPGNIDSDSSSDSTSTQPNKKKMHCKNSNMM